MLAAGQNLPSLLDNAGNLIFVVIWILLVVGGVLKNLFKKKSENAADDDSDEVSAAGVPASADFAQGDPLEIAIAMREAQQKRARAAFSQTPFPPKKSQPPAPSEAELRERRRALLLEKLRDAEARLARARNYAQKLEAQIAEEFPQSPRPPRSRELAAAYSARNARGGAAHAVPAEIFSDREALRRAVLAQEVLSPPLALRD